MGSCVSAKKSKNRNFDQKMISDRLLGEIYNLQGDLKSRENALISLSDKALRLGGELEHIMQENMELRDFIVSMKVAHAKNMRRLDRKIELERESAHIFEIRYKTMDGKLRENSKMGRILERRYSTLGQSIGQSPPSQSATSSNISPISSDLESYGIF